MTDESVREFARATKGLFEPQPQTVPIDLAPKGRVDVSSPPFLPSFTTEEKLACIEREINIRKHVYPNRILTKRMSKRFAEEQIAVMVAIANDYRGKA